MDRKARRRPRASRWQYPSVEAVAAVLVLARPTLPWEREAPTRHAIRISLVLQGMDWSRADWLGHSLVARARIAAGIRQPAGYDSDFDLSSWIEFRACAICDKAFAPRQRDHECCSDACRKRRWRIDHRPVELRRCARCGDQMEVLTSNQKYCSLRCRNSAQGARAWARHKQDQITHCRQCGELMSIWTRVDALYCSPRCSDLAEFAERRRKRLDARVAADLEAPRYCAHCSKPIPIGAPAGQKYCSNACNNRAYRARKLNGHATNGHCNADDLGPAAGNGFDHAGGRERGVEDRPGAGAGPPGAPRDDAAAGTTGGEAALG